MPQLSHGILPACLSLCPNFLLLIRTSVTGLEPTPSQCELILTWLHLQRLLSQIKSHSEVLGGHEPWGTLFMSVQTLSNSHPYVLVPEANSHVSNCSLILHWKWLDAMLWQMSPKEESPRQDKIKLDDFQKSFWLYTCGVQGPVNYFCSTDLPIQSSLSIPTAKTLVQPLLLQTWHRYNCFHITPPLKKNLHWLTPASKQSPVLWPQTDLSHLNSSDSMTWILNSSQSGPSNTTGTFSPPTPYPISPGMGLPPCRREPKLHLEDHSFLFHSTGDQPAQHTVLWNLREF